MEEMKLLKTLVAAHGPSGDEADIRGVIEETARPYADEITSDVMGNLIVHKRGEGPKVMLCAHMDSIGLVVTHVEKEGFVRFGTLGGIAPQEMLYTPVRFRSGVRGVIAREEKGDEEKVKLQNCYLDLGAASREEALSMVSLGDTAVYDTPCNRNGAYVVSPYLDNRISCAILLQVLAGLTDCPNDLYLVFTAQEEVGTRGAKTAAWGIDPDYALAVDVTDVEDTPGSQRYGTARLGGGAAIKVMDRSVICHAAVVERLKHLAQEEEIPFQMDIMRGGGTDAGAVHTTRLGVLTGGVSIPCRYIHTPVEMASWKDIQACRQLLSAFVTGKLPPVEG